MIDLFEKASIIHIPIGYDVGSINSLKPSSFPYADLAFDRGTSSTQTRDGSDGNIISIGQDIPRINYSSSVGYWLFEPQATNTATYSNDFTQGSIFVNASASPQSLVITPSQGISPDGTNNAWKMALSDTSEALHNLRYINTEISANNINVLSVFAKKGSGVDWLGIFADNLDESNRAWFDLENGVKGNLINGLNSTIEDYGGGWYRCSLAFSSSVDLISDHIRLVITDGDGESQYAGTTSDHHLIYGIQAESTITPSYTYPTSYIPTNNGIKTRDGETAINGGDSNLINSEEGVFYIEAATFKNDATDRRISLSDGTNSNRVTLQFTPGGQIKMFVFDGTTLASQLVSVDITTFNKIAIKFKANSYSLWVNGVDYGTNQNLGTFPSGTLTSLNLTQGSPTGLPFYGKIKCIAVFKEALTDTELKILTT